MHAAAPEARIDSATVDEHAVVTDGGAVRTSGHAVDQSEEETTRGVGAGLLVALVLAGERTTIVECGRLDGLDIPGPS